MLFLSVLSLRFATIYIYTYASLTLQHKCQTLIHTNVTMQ